MLLTLRKTENLFNARITAQNARNLSDLSRFLNGTCFKREIQNHSNEKPENHFKRSICRNQKQKRCSFFQVPKQKASRLALSIHFNEIGRSFDMHMCDAPLWASHLPLFFLARAAASTFFTREGAYVRLRNWEDALSLRGAPSLK